MYLKFEELTTDHKFVYPGNLTFWKHTTNKEDKEGFTGMYALLFVISMYYIYNLKF